MASTFTGRKRVRKNFGRIAAAVPMPNLIEVQKSSYDQFLQRHVTAENRPDIGLQEVFKSVFPIRDFSSRGTLEFVKYEFEDPKYDVEECQQRREIPDRENRFEDFLETEVWAVFGRHVPLQELIVGAFLHLDEIRHGNSRGNASKILPNALAARESTSHQ